MSNSFSGMGAVKNMLGSNPPWIAFTTVISSCFPCAVINMNNEIIVDRAANSYFSMNGVHDEIDLGVKILSGLSRDAYKSEPFVSMVKNDAFHFAIRAGINLYFGKSFTEDELEIIYTYLGNGINNALARRFITEGNLNTDWLLEEVRKEKEARREGGH